jgi:ADP-ribose pyrophosphatase YjhB (NUDIX family)
MKYDWLFLAQRLQSIAQAGLTYSENAFDIQRYEQLISIVAEILHDFTGAEMSQINNLLRNEKGYLTPKVDIRGVIFRKNKILMVKEKVDHCWSIPGGWADVGFTPFEVAEKEVAEESGLIVHASRLLAVLDKKRHNHPPDLYHIYKMFILCDEKGGELTPGTETSDVGFFSLEKIPSLSKDRITIEEIQMLFDFNNNPDKQTICD